jgi:hypothetical protein
VALEQQQQYRRQVDLKAAPYTFGKILTGLKCRVTWVVCISDKSKIHSVASLWGCEPGNCLNELHESSKKLPLLLLFGKCCCRKMSSCLALRNSVIKSINDVCGSPAGTSAGIATQLPWRCKSCTPLLGCGADPFQS